MDSTDDETNSLGAFWFCHSGRGRRCLQFLVHLRQEVGSRNFVEIGPTVQCNILNEQLGVSCSSRHFLHLFQDTGRATVIHDSMQSEEGGRFFREQNRNMIILLDPSEQLSVTENFRWLTLREILDLLLHSNYVNIQARSLLSLVDLNYWQMTDTIRVGVMGCASFARRSAIPAIRQCARMSLVAVASRGDDRAKEFADEFECISRGFGYENLISRSDVDLVYMPLPTGLHDQWSLQR